MRNILIALFTIISFHTFAADSRDPVRPIVTYNCTPDNYLITGTDGTMRSCYPYLCSFEGSGESYTPACALYCFSSDQCQPGTSCDKSTSQCVSELR